MSNSDTEQTPRGGSRRRWRTADWLLLIATIGLGTGAMIEQRRCTQCVPENTAPTARFSVDLMSERTLSPMMVSAPAQLRWMDVGDVTYSEEFRAGFSYDQSRVRVEYEPRAETLRGRLTAGGLKPWFVYQLKLVGSAPVRGAREQDNEGVPAWSSWQLGRMGRWWCEDCGWNLADAELADHIKQGHDVRGYVLFDWFVTDAAGDASHRFSLDSSLHVLWKVGQRDEGPNDSAPRWYGIARPSYAYAPADARTSAEIGVYGEWEPTRAKIGRLVVPPGEYQVRLNLTEETWHANMPEREVALGGFWPWVLDADLRFTVADQPAQISRASCPGCLPGPHSGTGLLWFRRGS